MMEVIRTVLLVSVAVVLGGLVIRQFIHAYKEIFRYSVEERLGPIVERYEMELRARDAYIRRLQWQAAHPMVEVTVFESEAKDDELDG